MNESTAKDPSEKSPPSDVVVQNANQETELQNGAASENVDQKYSAQNNSDTSIEPTNTPIQSVPTEEKCPPEEHVDLEKIIIKEEPALENTITIEDNEVSELIIPKEEPALEDTETADNETSENDIVAETKPEINSTTSTPIEENTSQHNKTEETAIEKEVALEYTKSADNEASENDIAAETKPEINSITSTPIEENTTEDNKTEKSCNEEDNTNVGKVLVITKMKKNTQVADVYTLVKDNTKPVFPNIYKNIVNVHLNVCTDDVQAFVTFKTVEHTALAISLLKVMKNPPFADVYINLPDQGIKRQASEATTEVSPVPQKQAKVEQNNTEPKVLFLCNVPPKWTEECVINFVKVNSKAKPEVYRGLLCLYGETDQADIFNGNWHLLFVDTNVCRLAFYYLRKSNRFFNNARIMIEYEYSSSTFAIPWLDNNKPDLETIKKNKAQQQQSGNSAPVKNNKLRFMPPKHNLWSLNPNAPSSDPNTHFIKQNIDHLDTYGISKQFLTTLGIVPPLSAVILVENLSKQYSDEGMIKKLFTPAGVVTNVYITRNVPTDDYIVVKVTFDHPVEAVQATSMFNNLEVHGKRLSVKMDKSRKSKRLPYPPGVSGFGPGLCPDGSPLINVRNSIEIQKAVNMLQSKIDELKSTIQSLQETVQRQPKQEKPTSAQDVQASMATNSLLALGAFLNPQAAHYLQLLQQPQATMLVPASPQPQNPNLNASVPAQVQHSQTATLSPNLRGAPIVQSVPNVKTRPYVQSAPQMQAAPNPRQALLPYPQAVINAPTGQYAQTAPNAAIGQYAQGGPNIAPAQYAQNAQTAAIGQNVSAGVYGQSGPSIPTGQFTQAGQNVAAAQITQGGHAANGQYAQSGQNIPAGQFTQIGPNTAPGQNMPAGQFTQGGPNPATGQYTQDGQNMPVGQFSQVGPNAATGQFTQAVQNMLAGQFIQGGQNAATGQYTQGGQNVSAGQFTQGVPNPATGQYTQGGQNVAAGQFTQGVPNPATGQYTQGGQNMPAGQFTQVGPNAATGQFTQGGQNMPAGQNTQGGPNPATGQFTQEGQNLPAGQFTQGGPNAATGLYAQGGPNMPANQFQQGGQIPAAGQNIPVGQYGQIRPTVPTGQITQTGPNAATAQFAQAGQAVANTASGKFQQSGPNIPAVPYAGPNAPVGQYVPASIPAGQLVQSGPNIPAGQYSQGGSNTAPGQGQNLPPGQYDNNKLRGSSSERYNKTPNSQPSPRDDSWGHNSCTVAFAYLPPSVTLPALKSKMTEVGRVRAAEMTGPGRARVAFYSPRDAADCIKLLDHTKVDGQTIEVSYY